MQHLPSSPRTHTPMRRNKPLRDHSGKAEVAYTAFPASKEGAPHLMFTPDSERVPEGDHSDTVDEAQAAVRALQQLHGAGACLKQELHLKGGG